MEEGTEYVPKDFVQDFRDNIMREFVAFQNFYNRVNAQLRGLRLNHVDLATEIFNDVMQVFGDDTQVIRSVAQQFHDRWNAAAVGGASECLLDVQRGYEEASEVVSTSVRYCAIFSNLTLNRMMTNNFYPTINEIQSAAASLLIPVSATIGQANVLIDEEDIVGHLQLMYTSTEFAWITQAYRRFGWETSRFETEGRHLVEEMNQCMAFYILDFMDVIVALENRIDSC